MKILSISVATINRQYGYVDQITTHTFDDRDLNQHKVDIVRKIAILHDNSKYRVYIHKNDVYYNEESDFEDVFKVIAFIQDFVSDYFDKGVIE